MPANGANVSRALVTLSVLVFAVALAACRTEYHPYDGRPVASDDAPADKFEGRRVFFGVDRTFYNNPPDCVVVLPAPNSGTAATVMARIESAVARHLRDKVPRVIGPLRRDRAARRLAIDLNHAGDRQRFGQIQNCDAFLRWRAIGTSNSYFLVWSGRDFGLDVELFREPGRMLWKASHVAHRSEGNLPLSPLSAPLAIFEAGQFSNDKDVLPSMLDDIMRRLMVSLPDVR